MIDCMCILTPLSHFRFRRLNSALRAGVQGTYSAVASRLGLPEQFAHAETLTKIITQDLD